MIKFLSKDKIRELPEVKSSSYFSNKQRRFSKEGLFSEVIFGPIYSYRCSCRKYYGKPIVEDPEAVCKVCGVNYTYSKLRRRRQHARIHLPIPVVNPIFFKFIEKIFGKSNVVIKTINTLMKDENTYLYWAPAEDGEGEEMYFYSGKENDEIPKNAKPLPLHEAIHFLIIDSCQEFVSVGLQKYQTILDNIDNLFIEDMLVIPPDCRPLVQKTNSKNVDEINKFYYKCLVKKELFNQTEVDVSTNRNLYYTYYIQFQRIINEYVDYIIDKLSKKEGIIRYNILGKRLDFSGRAVIAPDPLLKLDECILPYKMVLEVFRLHIAKRLVEIGQYRFTNQALKLIDDCIVRNDPVLLKICEQVVENEVCLLNRQPSLHRLGMIGFKIKVAHVSVIYIHPLVCSGFNADFDGDSLYASINLTRENGTCITKHISELKDTNMFKVNPEKEKENISHYDPTEELHIDAISLEDGTIAKKKVLDYSEHRNLSMYKIHDPQGNFEDFWVSDDHSLIVYDENVDKYLKISPIELLENPDGRYLVQQQ